MTIEYLHNPSPPRYTTEHWAEHHVYQGRLNQETDTAARAMIRTEWLELCIAKRMPHLHLNGHESARRKAIARGVKANPSAPSGLPRRVGAWEAGVVDRHGKVGS